MEFSEKLKELRNRKGISQTKLAEEIHISRSAYNYNFNCYHFICSDLFHIIEFGITDAKLQKKTRINIALPWVQVP